MALGDPYATLAQLKARFDIADAIDDDRLTDALDDISRGIEDHCERQFNDAGTTSARVYRPRTSCLAVVDDFSTTTGLAVATDEDGDGVFETTWAASDYELEPLNGIVAGRPGWPYWRIRAVDRLFPCNRRASVQVTAQWGWAAVPTPVQEACLIMAAETFKLGDAPFGVLGFGEFGAVRVRDNPIATRKLRPYELSPAKVA